MPIIQTQFGLFYILTFIEWNIVMNDWKLDENSPSKVTILQYSVIHNAQLCFYKEWQIKLGLHSMSVTLHVSFPTSVGDTTTVYNDIGDTKYNIWCSGFKKVPIHCHIQHCSNIGVQSSKVTESLSLVPHGPNSGTSGSNEPSFIYYYLTSSKLTSR